MALFNPSSNGTCWREWEQGTRSRQQNGFLEANSRVPWRWECAASCHCARTLKDPHRPGVRQGHFGEAWRSLELLSGCTLQLSRWHYQSPQVPKAPESPLAGMPTQSAAETVSEKYMGPLFRGNPPRPEGRCSEEASPPASLAAPITHSHWQHRQGRTQERWHLRQS